MREIVKEIDNMLFNIAMYKKIEKKEIEILKGEAMLLLKEIRKFEKKVR
jgi:hypothetical protein